jgi:hypothetical protein
VDDIDKSTARSFGVEEAMKPTFEGVAAYLVKHAK